MKSSRYTRPVKAEKRPKGESTSSPKNPYEQGNKADNSLTTIIGAVIGGIIVLLLIAFVIVFYIKRLVFEKDVLLTPRFTRPIGLLLKLPAAGQNKVGRVA